MMKMTADGVTLRENMKIACSQKEPVLSLGPGFTVDDSLLEKPTLLLGQVGSGKSRFLIDHWLPGIFSGIPAGDSVVVFAPKRELINGFYHPEKGDILISYDATEKRCIWNIFAEIRASSHPEQTLSELCDMIFSRHKNTVQPFFTSAPKDMLKSLIRYLFRYYKKQTGREPTNSTLVGFLNTLTVKDIPAAGQKGLLTLIREVPELRHLGDYLGKDGSTSQALGVLGELRAVIEETFQGGAFVKPGEFTVRNALKEGRKIFLLFDFSESTDSSMVFFDMLIDQMIKVSLKEDGRRVWFVLEEFSLIGKLQYLQQALAFGRGVGFRVIAAVQSAQLLEQHYTESEAACMLGLFPNLICFFTSDSKSRELLGNRYGESLVTVGNYGGNKPELIQQKAIQDADFFKISRPGDAIVSLAGYPPFVFHGHQEN